MNLRDVWDELCSCAMRKMKLCDAPSSDPGSELSRTTLRGAQVPDFVHLHLVNPARRVEHLCVARRHQKPVITPNSSFLVL
jgi:hypothetical protein